MEKSPAARSPSTIPLARDGNGNAIQVPESAVGWRIRRQTGGRPRLQLDGEKRPMLFPLHYTAADAEDILPPGNYRLDLVDKNGEPLEVTVPLLVGTIRNVDASQDAEDEPETVATAIAVPPTLPATTSDTRLVLEANVRATQMAFQHNQRTLELGLRMAETLRDGVHVLVDAQADWIKSMSSARGFFRNAPPTQVQLLPAPKDDGDDEEGDGDDEEDEDEDEHSGNARALVALVMEQLKPYLEKTSQDLYKVALAWVTKPRGPSSATTPVDDEPLEIADFLDWRRAKEKAERRKARAAAAAAQQAQGAAAVHAPPPPSVDAPAAPPGTTPEPVDLAGLLASLPADLVVKLMQARTLLSEQEQQDVMALLAHVPRDSLMAVLPQLLAMTPEQLAAELRAQVNKARKRPL